MFPQNPEEIVGKTYRGEVENCDKHGKYLPVRTMRCGKEIVGMCPECFEDEKKASIRKGLEEIGERMKQANLKNALIPEKYRNCSLENYFTSEEWQKSAVESVRNFIRFHKGRSLIFCGNTGTGKTHLGITALKSIIATGKTGIYCIFSELMRRIKSTWGSKKEDRETEADVLQSVLAPQILVLDELGVQSGSEKATDTDLAFLTEIIDRRSWDSKSSILISNLSFRDLPRWIGSRVISRLLENGGIAVPMAGSDYRTNGGK